MRNSHLSLGHTCITFTMSLAYTLTLRNAAMVGGGEAEASRDSRRIVTEPAAER